MWAPTGQRRVIRQPKVESHQHEERREKARCLTEREMEEKTQRGVGALIQRGGRAVAGMLPIATAGGS